MSSPSCPSRLLVHVVLLYWSASLLVLLFRLKWPDFEELTTYGGRNGVALSTSETRPSQKPALNRKEQQQPNENTLVTAWSSRFVSLLKDSPLGTIRISRKRSFTAFYLTGAVTSAFLLVLRVEVLQSAAAVVADVTVDDATLLTAVPLLLFALHCGVRLTETRCVQHFRHDDTVTLFAAVAGCTFYVVAALSSDVPITVVTGASSSRWIHRSTNLRCIFALGSMAHVLVQALQVMVHTLLANMQLHRTAKRRSAKEAGPSLQMEEEAVWRHVQAGLAGRNYNDGEPLKIPGSWLTYHFPYFINPVFQLVLEPHYTCEVLLFTLNTALMVLCILPSPLHASDVTTESGLRPSICAPTASLSVAASVGVTTFTLLNLGITSAEHRRFWNRSNAVRREVANVLRTSLHSQPSPSSSVSERTVKSLPVELTGVATQLLQVDLAEEVLPRWNLVPLIW